MYRNNFRSPHLQPRNSVGMGNGSCGGRRNTGSEDYTNMRTAPDCGCQRPQTPDCGCPCPPKPPVPDCDCPCPPKPPVPDCDCPCPPKPPVPDCDCSCPVRPSVPVTQPDCIVVIEKECDCSCGKPEKNDSGCRPSKNDPVAGLPLAMAYVPWQDYRDIYPEEEGWCNGTIFAQLDLEFVCRRCN